MNDLEQQWAKELKKAKQRVDEKQIPLDIQKKRNEEEMEYFRGKLLESIEKNNKEETQKYFENIIKIRAIQTVLEIKEKNLEQILIDEEFIEPIIKDFFSDCIKLAISIDKLFEKNK